MAKHFQPEDIDEFRECFYLYNKSGVVYKESQLAYTMRSLAFSPTVKELRNYWGKYSKEGQMDFASFLETLHEHSQSEDCEREIMAAFEAQDPQRSGMVSSKEFRGILRQFGERLSDKEINDLLVQSGQTGPTVSYKSIIKHLLVPVPDY